MNPDDNTGQLRWSCLVHGADKIGPCTLITIPAKLRYLVRMDVCFWIDVCHIEGCKDGRVYIVRRNRVDIVHTWLSRVFNKGHCASNLFQSYYLNSDIHVKRDHTVDLRATQRSYRGSSCYTEIIPWIFVLHRDHTVDLRATQRSYRGSSCYTEILPWIFVLHRDLTVDLRATQRSYRGSSRYTEILSWIFVLHRDHTVDLRATQRSYLGSSYYTEILPWIFVLHRDLTVDLRATQRSYRGSSRYTEILSWIFVLHRDHSVDLRATQRSYRGSSCYTEILSFENTRKLAYGIMSMFGSTYRCEQLFSLMKGNKTPIRSRITDVHLGSVLKLITANKISPEVFWIVFDFYLLKKMDQRTCIKFCVKNEIKCADAFRMLTVAYGEATLDRSNVYRWYKMFSEGREDVNDEGRAGRPSTSTTDEKINEVEKMILANYDKKHGEGRRVSFIGALEQTFGQKPFNRQDKKRHYERYRWL
ncbi:hypothetical protein LAZ67_1002785 [Cordylochernes scorpioides]|uniref:Mos1 transposase HTH domain-containing protein n=1 Tax=Cordylochernes scorpioides TaxID=51811 RepID=A0ABY6JWB9_9ARAC|nr:hypothetical protein LAZ67_1002785 [Cordylochernes scorpioides]